MSRFQTQQIDASDYRKHGYFDTDSQCQYVLSEADRHVDESRNVYVLGHAGVDGIEFVLKPNDHAVYAYVPIGDEFVRLAPDFDSFITGWRRGSIEI